MGPGKSVHIPGCNGLRARLTYIEDYGVKGAADDTVHVAVSKMATVGLCESV